MRTVAASWFLMATILLGTEIAKPDWHIWQAFLAGVCAYLTVQFTVCATQRAIRNEHHRKWLELLDDSTDHRS